MVIDSNVRDRYRFRCFRVLRKIDESFLQSMDEDERAFLSGWVDNFQTMDILARDSAKAIAKVAFRAAVIGVTNGLIDSHVGDDFSSMGGRFSVVNST